MTLDFQQFRHFFYHIRPFIEIDCNCLLQLCNMLYSLSSIFLSESAGPTFFLVNVTFLLKMVDNKMISKIEGIR